jgi:pilus assembly protein CpaD
MNGASIRAFLSVVLIAGAASLAGCNSPGMSEYDPHQKFPVGASQKTAVLFLEPAANGAVRADDRARIDEFAKDFRDRNAGPIGIAVGATSKSDPAAAAFAGNIREALAAQGIPAAVVTTTMHPEWASGGAHRATVMFPIYVADVPNCGITNEYMEINYYNQDSGNFGCSIQRNTALMAVNPQDLEQMQPSTGRWGLRSGDIVGKYAVGQTIASPAEAQATTTSSVSSQ